jgi:hypothetical protein
MHDAHAITHAHTVVVRPRSSSTGMSDWPEGIGVAVAKVKNASMVVLEGSKKW